MRFQSYIADRNSKIKIINYVYWIETVLNKNKMKIALIITLIAVFHATYADSSVTSEENFANITAVPYAYGDFNADKLVDIFCVTHYESSK